MRFSKLGIFCLMLTVLMLFFSGCSEDKPVSDPTSSKTALEAPQSLLSVDPSKAPKTVLSKGLYSELLTFWAKADPAEWIEDNPVNAELIKLGDYYVKANIAPDDEESSVLSIYKDGHRQDVYTFEKTFIGDIALLEDGKLFMECTEDVGDVVDYYITLDLTTLKTEKIVPFKEKHGNYGYWNITDEAFVKNGRIFFAAGEITEIEGDESDFTFISEPFIRSDIYEYDGKDFKKILSGAGNFNLRKKDCISYTDEDFKLKNYNVETKVIDTVQLHESLTKYYDNYIYQEKYLLGNNDDENILLDITTGEITKLNNGTDSFAGGIDGYLYTNNKSSILRLDLPSGASKEVLRVQNAEISWISVSGSKLYFITNDSSDNQVEYVFDTKSNSVTQL